MTYTPVPDPALEHRLERLLRDAKAAHEIYEGSNGVPDADWPRWYARFIAQRL